MNNDKNIYLVNDDTDRQLYDSLFMLGIDSLEDYFKLLNSTVQNKSNLPKKKRKKNVDIITISNKIKNHKINKIDLKILGITILLSTGIISVGKITRDIRKTRDRNDIRSLIVENETNLLLEQGIAIESYTGEKGNVIVKDNAPYENITDDDITPSEVFNFMIFIQSNYEDPYIQKKLLNDFITNQTYNNGTNYYLDWNDYLKHNNFSNNKEFTDFCYQNIESNKKVVKKL